MSALIALNHRDFFISKGVTGNLLSTRIKGLCLVLFYSNACPNCLNLIPIFKALPGTVSGCSFAAINLSVDGNRNCIAMSQQTKMPIKYVPMLILYVDGKPHMRYTGEGNLQMIRNFIVEVYNRLIGNTQPMMGTIKESKKHIPRYTIGHPLYGKKKDNKSYLVFNGVYRKK